MKTLFECLDQKSVVVVWGRFNPPHIGHEHVVNRAILEAQRLGADCKIFLSPTHDIFENPLTFEQKLDVMCVAIPSAKPYLYEHGDIKTLAHVLEVLNRDGYSNIYLLAGADRYESFKKLKENVTVIHAGLRDEESPGVVGASSSKMREAVVNNSYEEFCKYTTTNMTEHQKIKLFTLIKSAIKNRSV